MASNPVAELLATVPLFSTLNAKERRQLARYCNETTVPSGTVLMRQGAVGVDCYILLEGTATVSRNDQPLAEIGKGDLIGELAPIDHLPRSATVVATSEVRVLVLSAHDLTSAIDSIPGLARNIMTSLAHRVRALDDKLLAS
jgi:CRP/FNR family transcriptional regulator, cyclic AMP receptor protein